MEGLMLDYGFYNCDCMEGMREFPDKYFDIAIVDPPYGDGSQGGGGTAYNRFGGWFDRYKEVQQVRREVRPVQEYHGGGITESTSIISDRRDMGREVRQKNYRVGRRAGERVL